MTATDFMKELDRKGHTWCEGRFFEISGPLTYRLGDDIRVGAGRNAKGLDLEFPEVKCQGEPVDAYFLEEEIKTVLKKGAVVTIRGKCCQADSGPGGDAYFENCELIAWPGMGKQK
jgi:hypothetical protein